MYWLQTILLTIVSFKTEAGHDFLHIYDGNSTSAREIAVLDGEMPAGLTYRSTGNTMHLYFQNDWNVAYEGFHLTYEKYSK
jgi:hypothetical protein